MSDRWPILFRLLDDRLPGPSTEAARFLRHIEPDRDALAVAWYVRERHRYSPARLVQGLMWLNQGYDDVYEVKHLTRGAPAVTQYARTPGLAVAIRPASSGRWGKPAVLRIDRPRPEIQDAVEDLYDRAGLLVRFCAQHEDCCAHPSLALACRRTRYPQRDAAPPKQPYPRARFR